MKNSKMQLLALHQGEEDEHQRREGKIGERSNFSPQKPPFWWDNKVNNMVITNRKRRTKGQAHLP